MIEEEIRSQGMVGIFLRTDKDKPSYRFYMKNGYKDLELHVNLDKSCYISVVILRENYKWPSV